MQCPSVSADSLLLLDLDDIFSTRRPRDAIAGSASGLKTFARSLVAGAANLIQAPVVGARGGGLCGAVRGLGEGAVSAVVLPVTGVVVGATQCVRGVVNTPVAFLESLAGQEWDARERRWISPSQYNVFQEARWLEASRACAAGQREDADENGQDEEASNRIATVQRHPGNYYGLLRVMPSASYTDIRRAYYRESRRCHPDKAGTDLVMIERFQQLNDAYQVLRNTHLRSVYDEGGSEAIAQLAMTVDLGMLYMSVLDGELWEPLLGQLSLSRILSSSHGAKGGDREKDESTTLELLGSVWSASDPGRDSWQAAREVRIAQRLTERLEAASSCSLELLKSSAREEGRSLARSSPFAGAALLRAIAAAYEDEARRFLGSLASLANVGREVAEGLALTRRVARQGWTLTSAVRCLVAIRSIADDEVASAERTDSKARGDSTRGTQATAAFLEAPRVREHLPVFASALWHLTLLDVEATLRRACRRALRDGWQCHSLQERALRAQRLAVVASGFWQAAEKCAKEDPGGASEPGQDPLRLQQRVRAAAASVAAASASGRS